ncbi:MAG: histone deacetylase [Opitutaceae bacterium]|nr:histone deacetylase [Opitutaceae bacterium]
MLILHDPRCAEYGSDMRPEQPMRVIKTAAHLRSAHPDWSWRVPAKPADDETLRLAHSAAHLCRLSQPRDFDADTPYFPGIEDHARRAVAAAIDAAEHALDTKKPAFSLMRPPGHHATMDTAMGFCYLNQIAIAAVSVQRMLAGKQARTTPAKVAIWDFDAHHGNGTESIVRAREGLFFASVHQYPGYPGTGTQDHGPHVRNWPVAPRTPRVDHMAALRSSLDAVVSYLPDLILVSAGFDAYARDPITAMTLEREDFATLGRWLRETGRPAAAILEGGYGEDLPLLIDAFLSAWNNSAQSAA